MLMKAPAAFQKFPYGPARQQDGTSWVAFLSQADTTLDVPRYAIPDLAAQSCTMADGSQVPAIDVRTELATAADHDLTIYVNSRGHHTHYHEALIHPWSDRLLAKGLIEEADELDNLYQHFHGKATKGKGQIMIATTAPGSQYDLRAFALALHDAEVAGQPPPPCPWSTPERVKARQAKAKSASSAAATAAPASGS